MLNRQTNMIYLYLSEGEIFLYNIKDWSVLRREYRIVGEIVGNSLHTPSLPLKILPEEACLLISKNIVTLLEAPKQIIKEESDKSKLEEYSNKLLEAQIADYKVNRRAQINLVIDQIIAKQNDTRSKEVIVNEHLAKSQSVIKNNMVWPIHMSASNNTYNTLKSINLEETLKLTTPLKWSVYSDLWEKGYYITQAHKFGGDFLIYLGEPVCHHAVFIVKCINKDANLSPLELIAFGRLGTSVKKRAVLASTEENKVSYITINWIDA